MDLSVVRHHVCHGRIFSGVDNKVTWQSIACAFAAHMAASVQAVRDNHFPAFGAQDVDKILLDYTDKSVLKAYEYTDAKLTTATGSNEIRAFFVGLFALLKDLSGLDAPVVEPTENQVYPI